MKKSIEDAVRELQGDVENGIVGEIPLGVVYYCSFTKTIRESYGPGMGGALICTLDEFNACADRLRNKPCWGTLPAWVEWIAQDKNGEWFGYADAPYQCDTKYSSRAGKRSLGELRSGEILGDWRDTLEQRPEAIPAPEYNSDDVAFKPSKYHVKINGDWCDVYDVLTAYGVTNPAAQHAIKKMLKPGKRGHKSTIEDMEEAIQSLERAIEIEEKGNA